MWEVVRPTVVALIPDNSVQVVRESADPTTVEGIIEDRAYSWLKSPEALDLAKNKVTEDLVEELSKI
jgi:hypothetical protein